MKNRGISLPPQLSITKVTSNALPLAFDEMIYTITVDNAGGSTDPSVVVDDLLPPDMPYSSHVASSGSYDPLTGVWSVGPLGVGQQATLDITVLPSPPPSTSETYGIIGGANAGTFPASNGGALWTPAVDFELTSMSVFATSTSGGAETARATVREGTSIGGPVVADSYTKGTWNPGGLQAQALLFENVILRAGQQYIMHLSSPTVNQIRVSENVTPVDGITSSQTPAEGIDWTVTGNEKVITPVVNTASVTGSNNTSGTPDATDAAQTVTEYNTKIFVFDTTNNGDTAQAGVATSAQTWQATETGWVEKIEVAGVGFIPVAPTAGVQFDDLAGTLIQSSNQVTFPIGVETIAEFIFPAPGVPVVAGQVYEIGFFGPLLTTLSPRLVGDWTSTGQWSASANQDLKMKITGRTP